MEQQDILFTETQGKNGNLGIVTLNRPSALNSLTHEMINRLYQQLQTWGASSAIKGVVVRAVEGRAFCAGGDIRLTYERHKTNDPAIVDFFRDEYQLNRTIFHFPKPYIALLDGITMGGGAGISINGSHRVATENLLFAMPETGIGFFPDVGGTYFLPRLPGKFGYYLGLCGVRLGCDDSVAIGLAQAKVMRNDLPALLDALAAEDFGDVPDETVMKVIERFKTPIKFTDLMDKQAIINECFLHDSVEAIMQALEDSASKVCQEAAVLMAAKSPTSLKITLLALQQGRRLDFDACMRQEFRLTTRFLQQHDFFEGIRAVIIDKDQSPKWEPSTLAGVTQIEVDKYFAPLTEELV